MHNVYVTPDGKYAVAGSIDAKNLTVVDLQTEQAVWNLNLGSGVRPMAFDAILTVRLNGFLPSYRASTDSP